jgi:hypothetical protein
VLAIVAIVVLGALVLALIIATRPSEFRVARSATIHAPAEAIFPHVNDFHNWLAWSPYDKRDPLMKRTYEGPPQGTGASYAWNGNGNVGEGRSTIIESRPGELIRIQLEFVRPFAGTNTAEFLFQPQGRQTSVTWALSGKYNLMSKAVGLFMNMDKMIGSDFDQGLANLKTVVEDKAK